EGEGVDRSWPGRARTGDHQHRRGRKKRPPHQVRSGHQGGRPRAVPCQGRRAQPGAGVTSPAHHFGARHVVPEHQLRGMDTALALPVAPNRASLEGRRSGVRKLQRSRASPDVASLHRTLARNFPDSSLVLFDHELRYIVAGDEADSVSELAPAGCVGKTVRDVLPAEVAETLEPLYRAALAGRRVSAEVAYDDRWLLVRAGPVRDEQGAIVAGMSLSQDITDAKHAEQALRGSRDLLQEIIESSSDAIVAKDLEGRYVLINSSEAGFLGRPATEIVGGDDPALSPADQGGRSCEADARVRARGESETAEEHLVIDGRRRVLLLTRSPLRDYDGRIIGVLGVA